MDGACSMHFRDGKYIQNISQKTEEKRPLRNVGIDERIILQ